MIRFMDGADKTSYSMTMTFNHGEHRGHRENSQSNSVSFVVRSFRRQIGCQLLSSAGPSLRRIRTSSSWV